MIEIKTKVFHYILYSFLLFGVLLFTSYVDVKLKQIATESFSLFPWTIYRLLLFIPMGLLIGLPYLLKERQKEGRWGVNYLKLIFIGLPALYFTLYFIFHFYLQFLRLPSHLGYLLTEVSTYKTTGVIVGFILITSVYKKNKWS
ncbi:hypothetical protein IM538_04430 [Cytobacillus suaedae]|nr:hypothetical protein IM538_04430 [Cytobacillus suaedae]